MGEVLAPSECVAPTVHPMEMNRHRGEDGRKHRTRTKKREDVVPNVRG